MNRFVYFNQSTMEYEFVPEHGFIANNIVYNLQFLDSLSIEELKTIGISPVEYVYAPNGYATTGVMLFSENPNGYVTATQEFVDLQNSTIEPVV